MTLLEEVGLRMKAQLVDQLSVECESLLMKLQAIGDLVLRDEPAKFKAGDRSWSPAYDAIAHKGELGAGMFLKNMYTGQILEVTRVDYVNNNLHWVALKGITNPITSIDFHHWSWAPTKEPRTWTSL